MPDHLFVYGTLRPGHAPDEIADVVGSLKPVGEGVLRGTRYNLGPYPAVPSHRSKAGRVQGEVFALPDDPDAIRRLDEYEEFDPKHPNQSLFRRAKAQVTLSNGSKATCWVYLYNGKIPKAKLALSKRVNRAALAKAGR